MWEMIGYLTKNRSPVEAPGMHRIIPWKYNNSVQNAREGHRETESERMLTTLLLTGHGRWTGNIIEPAAQTQHRTML
jgi:uncharacterized protein (DUF2147 family)